MFGFQRSGHKSDLTIGDITKSQTKHDRVRKTATVWGVCLAGALCAASEQKSVSHMAESHTACCLWSSRTLCLSCSHWGGLMHWRALQEEVWSGDRLSSLSYRMYCKLCCVCFCICCFFPPLVKTHTFTIHRSLSSKNYDVEVSATCSLSLQ